MKKIVCFIFIIFSSELIFAQPEKIYSQSTTERDITEILNQYIEAINCGNKLMNILATNFYDFNDQLIENSSKKDQKIYFSDSYQRGFFKEVEWCYWGPTYCCDLSSFSKKEKTVFEQFERIYPIFLSFDSFINSLNQENKLLLKSYQQKLDYELGKIHQLINRTIGIKDSISNYIEEKNYLQDRFNQYQDGFNFLYEAKNIDDQYQSAKENLEKLIQEAYNDLLKKENKKSTSLKRFYKVVNEHIDACKKLLISLKNDSAAIEEQLATVKSYVDQLTNYEKSIIKNDSIVKWIRYLDVYHNKGECCLSGGFYSRNEQIVSDSKRFLAFYDSFVKENDSNQYGSDRTDYGQMRKSLEDLVQDYNYHIRVSDTPLLKLTYLFNPFDIKEVDRPESDPVTQGYELKNALPVNLLLLIDISASMNEPEKLPLIKETIYWLSDLLRKKDYLSVVTYADNPTIYLNNISGDKQSKIKKSIDDLKAKGKTNIDKALPVAFEVGIRNFISEGNNKIVLITDGLFKINEQQEVIIKNGIQQGMQLSVFYFGKKEKGEQIELLKKISSWGAGNYYYITKKNIRSILFNEIKKIKKTNQ